MYWLQTGLYLSHPCVDALVGLVVFVHLVERQTYKLSVNHRFRIVERIAVGRHATDNVGTCILCRIVYLRHSAYEGVGVRLGVAASEDSYSLALKVGTLERLQSVVPVVLHLASTPCRCAENQIVVVGDDAVVKVGDVDDVVYAQFGTYSACQVLTSTSACAIDDYSLLHNLQLFLL